MERLTNVDELLDGPLDDPATLAGNLRDLRRINRLLGGVRLSRMAVDRLIEVTAGSTGGRGAADNPITLLDVGTGGADIPIALLADARRRGRALRVTGVDARPEILAAARGLRPGLAGLADLTLDLSDGRSLPFADASFDVAHASLVVHHLEPEDAVALLQEMARVARRGIVVNDLARGRGLWLGALVLTRLLTRNRYTRNDGPLSIRRAYTPAETRGLLERAGLRPLAEVRGLAGHRYAIAAGRA